MNEFKILNFSVRKNKSIDSKASCYKVAIKFTFPEEDEVILSSFLESYNIVAYKDYSKYKKGIEEEIEQHDDFLEFLNRPRKDDGNIIRVDIAGRNKLVKAKGGIWSYTEFVTKTPVVDATIMEIRKMKRKPTHSYKTTPPYYFAKLLESLDNHWD